LFGRYSHDESALTLVQTSLISIIDDDMAVLEATTRVAAVVAATRGQVGSVEEYAEALEERIASLVNAHELMGQSRAVSLSELVCRQLAPYAVAGNSALIGPDLALSSEAAEAIALVMHELVTNAAKYGALSVTGGQVMVQWEQGLDGALGINWREVGGPTITDRPDSGHGLSLIRDLIPHELAGKVAFKYATNGVECTITIPAAHLRGIDLGPRGSGSRWRQGPPRRAPIPSCLPPVRRPVEGEHSSGDSKQRIRQVPRKCDNLKSSPYARESYRPRAGDGRHDATPIRVPRSARLLCPSLTTQPRRECLQDLPVFRLDERETRIDNPEIQNRLRF
jgi:two-component sensor histidine kinase